MRISKVIKFIATIGVITMVTFYGWVWYGMSSSSCVDTLLSEKESTDGKYLVGIFEGDCGATTGYIYHINFRNKNKNFVTENTGLVVKNQICGASGDTKFDIYWESPTQLIVEKNKSIDQLNCVNKFNEVSVVVREKNREHR